MIAIEVRRYVTPGGSDVIGDWLASLADVKAWTGGRDTECDGGQDMRASIVRGRQTPAVVRHKKGDRVPERLQGKDAEQMKDKASVSHDESMARELRENPDFAAEYLRAAMEDEAEPRVLLVALRRVAEARGLAKVAKTAGIERESLYRALSPRGNPRFSTLVAVAKAMGLRLTFESGR
jgi:probable addiction module antidote protein